MGLGLRAFLAMGGLTTAMGTLFTTFVSCEIWCSGEGYGVPGCVGRGEVGVRGRAVERGDVGHEAESVY